MATIAAPLFVWDEPEGCSTPRGWLHLENHPDGDTGYTVGNYLDYGPNHYRSPHQYCRAGHCDCRESQPGNVHAVAYIYRICPITGRRHKTRLGYRYCETIEQAREWIESAVSDYLAKL